MPPLKKSFWALLVALTPTVAISQVVNFHNSLTRHRTFKADEHIDFNGRFFFAGYSNEYGTELWVSEGKDSVKQLFDINEGEESSNPRDFYVNRNKLYFSTGIGSANNSFLWAIDSAKDTAIYLTETRNPRALLPWDNRIVFTNEAKELWISDGTGNGTFRLTSNENVIDLYNTYYNHVVYKNRLFFNAKDSLGQWELWVSNGTTNGTHVFKDLNPNGWSSPRSFNVFNDRLYFTARSEESFTQTGLWVSDGTAIGTRKLFGQLSDLIHVSRIIGEVNGRLLFDGRKDGLYTLWSVDSSQNISEVFQTDTHQGLFEFIRFNTSLVMSFKHNTKYPALWVSDGTNEGTRMLKSISDKVFTDIGQFKQVDSLIYFVARDDQHGYELWVTDGTVSGSKRVSDISGNHANLKLSLLTPYNGKLYFKSSTSDLSETFFVSDGSVSGTRPVESPLIPKAGNMDECYTIASGNNSLYFQAGFSVQGNLVQYRDTNVEVSNVARRRDQRSTKVKVYPTVFDNVINLEFLEHIEPTCFVTLHDLNGRMRIKQQVTLFENRKVTLSTSDLQPGFYYLTYAINGYRYVEKVLKL